jgi:hypothetical protein
VIELESSVVAVVASAEGYRTGSMMATSGSFEKNSAERGISQGSDPGQGFVPRLWQQSRAFHSNPS